MLNDSWQQDRIFTTPVGLLQASFLLRPNTMFHRDGEWSVRMILPPDDAWQLRQTIAPAYEDILKRGREGHAALPAEQRTSRPFKEIPYWQHMRSDGGPRAEDVYFTFRAPVSDHKPATRIPLVDGEGRDVRALATEPEGQEAIISFSIHQFWLRSFGAGVTLRLKTVQLLGARDHRPDAGDQPLEMVPGGL